MRASVKKTRLEVYKHERAAKIVQALLTGLHPRLRYGKEDLQQLVAQVRRTLCGRELPDPWRIALNKLEDALQKELMADESLLWYIVEQAQLDAVQVAWQMEQSPTSPDSAINHAREFVRACMLQQIALIGSRLYSSAREMDIEQIANLIEGLNLDFTYLSTVTNKTKLQPETPAQLIEHAAEQTEWLWQGIIPARHLTLLAGREKQRGGKSTLLFALISHMLRGKPFINRETKPQRILYLSEETRESVRDKLITFGIEDTDSLLLLTREAFLGGTRGALLRHQSEIEQIVKRHNIGMLIVDTFQSFSAIRGDGENSVGEIQAALAPLVKLSSQGVGAIVVHHHNKSEGEPRGSTALTGAVDVILNISRKGGEHAQNRRILEYEGRFGVGVIEYGYNPEIGEYTYYGSPRESDSKITQQQVLTALLKVGSSLSEAEIREELGGSIAQQRVNEALNALMQAGTITRIGAGKRGNPYRYTVLQQESAESTVNPMLTPQTTVETNLNTSGQTETAESSLPSGVGEHDEVAVDWQCPTVLPNEQGSRT